MHIVVAVVGVVGDFLIDQLLFWFRIAQCLLKKQEIINILFKKKRDSNLFLMVCFITSVSLGERESRIIEIRLASCKTSCVGVIHTEHSACFREKVNKDKKYQQSLCFINHLIFNLDCILIYVHWEIDFIVVVYPFIYGSPTVCDCSSTLLWILSVVKTKTHTRILMLIL